ncbi:AAA domain-containing protein [Psidium guajava]|nr:AAA domain-containing protein [Psidium guajava]
MDNTLYGSDLNFEACYSLFCSLQLQDHGISVVVQVSLNCQCQYVQVFLSFAHVIIPIPGMKSLNIQLTGWRTAWF